MRNNSEINYPKFLSFCSARNHGGEVLFLLFLFSAFSVSSQQLESYIREAEGNNPEIQSFELKHDIASEKVNEVNALPATEFGVGYFVRETETRNGPQRARFSVRQEIPWFGTITARENYAGSMADAQYLEITIARRKLALSVAQSYYRLYANKAKQKVLVENIELLKTYHQLSLNALEVGGASAVDVLKLQMRQNELARQKGTLEQEYESQTVLFNNLLNREETAAIELADSLVIPEEGDAEMQEVAKVHPELLKFDELYESVTEAEKLNQIESRPELGFGLDYVVVAKRTDIEVEDNGMDMLMPMVALSIPIFTNQYKSTTRQNELRQKEILAERKHRLNTLQTMLKEAVSGRAAARIKATTFLSNLEQANDAEEILVKSYETGTIDFNDVLEIQELQLNFQLGLIEAVEDYYEETAVVNYLSL